MNPSFSHLCAFAVALLLPWACEKPGQDPADNAPTAVTLSQSTLTAPQNGGTVSVEITAPTRPKLMGLPEWITCNEGAYTNYKMKVDFTVSANERYESRSAAVTVFSAGAAVVELTITQEAKSARAVPALAALDDTDPRKIAAKLGLGWNMGNHFDGYFGDWAGEKEGYPDETVWQGDTGGKATQSTFYGVKDAGFTSVRIPVSWLRMIGPAPAYTIDATWMDRVFEVVQFARNAGLYVIINTHHDENHGVDNTYQWLDIKNAANDPALNTRIKEEIKAVWTQIAEKFKDCDDWLIMEGFNELNDGGWGWSEDFRANPSKQCGILNEWNQLFVETVRATGGKNASRWLGVPTYAANPAYEQYITMPSDPAGRTMLAVHFYDPSEYTIGKSQWSDWGHTGAAGKKDPSGDENHVQEVFGNLSTKYVDKGIPVYWGEFGCSVRNRADTRAWKFYMYYLEYVVKAAHTYGMPAFLWDNGTEGYGQEKHGYIHHGTGEYVGHSKEVIDVMVKAMTSTDASYTLQSLYDNAPKP